MSYAARQNGQLEDRARGMEWGVAEQHCQVKDTRRGDNRKLRIADNQWEDREDREKRLGKVSMQQRRCLC